MLPARLDFGNELSTLSFRSVAERWEESAFCRGLRMLFLAVRSDEK
jgi:hypothetical protein